MDRCGEIDLERHRGRGGGKRAARGQVGWPLGPARSLRRSTRAGPGAGAKYHRPMEDVAEDVLGVAAALARLQVRLLAKLPEGRRMPNGVIRSAVDSRWRLEDLGWTSPWLDQVSPGQLVENVVPRVALVQAHLLAMLEAGDIDPRKACLAVHHLCAGGRWSGMVKRLAKRWQVDLAPLPMEELRGPSALEREPLPERKR